MSLRAATILVVLVCTGGALHAQEPDPEPDAHADTRAQYPVLLANSYFSLNVGYIEYPFSARQLEPGFQVDSVSIPHVGVRAVLIGHQFHKYFAVQASYLRPVRYVSYHGVNG